MRKPLGSWRETFSFPAVFRSFDFPLLVRLFCSSPLTESLAQANSEYQLHLPRHKTWLPMLKMASLVYESEVREVAFERFQL